MSLADVVRQLIAIGEKPGVSSVIFLGNSRKNEFEIIVVLAYSNFVCSSSFASIDGNLQPILLVANRIASSSIATELWSVSGYRPT